MHACKSHACMHVETRCGKVGERAPLVGADEKDAFRVSSCCDFATRWTSRRLSHWIRRNGLARGWRHLRAARGPAWLLRRAAAACLRQHDSTHDTLVV